MTIQEKYNAEEFDKAWHSFDPDGGIGVGSLVHYAKLHGYVDAGVKVEGQQAGNGTADSGTPEPDILALDRGRISIPTTPPTPRNYVWQGLVVAGHAYALGGFGGVSKSQAALQLGASIAMGIPFGNVATKKGSVLIVFGEDDKSEIERRTGAYAAQANLSAAQRKELEKNMRAFGLVGIDTRLTAPRNGILESTTFAGKIIATVAELEKKSGEPTGMIILDHVGLFHGGDFNAREDVSLTMRIANHIAHETGAAVLLLAHSPKSATVSETSETSAVAGSTAFVDQTRGAFILATMRPNEAKALGIPDAMRPSYVSMATVKSNYGKTGGVIWFKRDGPSGWEVGVLVPVDLQTPVKVFTPKGTVAVQSRILQFIADHPGQYTKTALRNQLSGKDGTLKASKPEMEIAIEEMLSTGLLVNLEPTTDDRKKFGHTQQVKAVLYVPVKAV